LMVYDASKTPLIYGGVTFEADVKHTFPESCFNYISYFNI